MLPRVARVVATVALGCALTLSPGLAADEKPASPAKEPPAKPTDWSRYVVVGDVVGEVVKADDKKLTLRVTWFVQEVKGGNKNNNNNNRRPPLGQNNRNFKGGNNRPPQQPQVTVKEQHHDYEIEYVPESLVRTKLLPLKTDDKGKRVNHTQKELDALRAPPGAPWYAASPADLEPGHIVEVIFVREKTIPAAKATEDDLRVKYAIILGKDSTPPVEDKKKKN
ncbi:MAG: hypothetical protein C0501_00900 [Isosphaera sp.]|nr:hypothetical protein [Isosphaera sp.]